MSVESLGARDARVLASAQKLRFSPVAAVAGRGARLIEADGRELIDLSASWSAAGLGYAHPAVVAAVQQAVAEMPGASVLSQVNPQAVALAEELVATMPSGADYAVYVGLSGSDANAAALRCVHAYTSRAGLVAFAGSYHGGLGPAQEVSGLYVATGIAPAPGLRLLPYPVFAAAAADVVARLDAELAAGDVAAVIVEPIMSDGGMLVPPPGFLADLHRTCHARQALLICDEVKVGLGRTGLLHAFAHDGVVPDVVTFGKSLGGGLPLSAAVGRADILNATPGASLLTTAGNPVCAAAGRAVLRTVLAEDLPAVAAALGARLLGQLAQLADAHDLVVDVRGKGLAAGVELRADGAAAAKVALRAYQLGAVVYYVGPRSNVLELTPPLVISETELDEGVEILDRALRDVAAGRVSDEAIAEFAGW